MQEGHSDTDKADGRNTGIATHGRVDRSSTYFHNSKSVMGPAARRVALRFWAIYLTGSLVGNYLFLTSQYPVTRVLGAGLIFPGTGYLALSGWYNLAFLANLALLPVAIFLWFFVGAVPLPVGCHLGAALLASWLARNRPLLNVPLYLPMATWFLNLGIFALWIRHLSLRRQEEETLKLARSAYVPTKLVEVNTMREKALSSKKLGDIELTPEQLKYTRFIVNLTRQPLDEWKGFTHIEQFRDSSLRYQANWIGYSLGTMQANIMPNFHGYISRAQRTAIEKTLLPASLNYWAFESVWGRGSLDFDPIAHDNIMLTGWLLFAVMLYTSATRDLRYMNEGSLKCQVTPFHRYYHSAPSMVRALMKNWTISSHTMFPCEPHWIFPICNLYGAIGVQIYDRLIGTENLNQHIAKLREVWEDDYITPGGNHTLTRSTLAPVEMNMGGLLHVNLANFAQTIFPELADYSRAVFSEENFDRNPDGSICRYREDSQDYYDIGNYKTQKLPILGLVACLITAKETGDTEMANHLERRLDEELHLLDDGAGGVRPAELSTLMAIQVAHAKMHGCGFYHDAILKGPPPEALAGPLLAEVDYPYVLVAKAWSNGEDLDLVLYDGEGKITSKLLLERLKPRIYYSYGDLSFYSSDEGKAEIEITVDGRTHVLIKPASPLKAWSDGDL